MLVFLLMTEAISLKLPAYYHTSEEIELRISSLDCPNLKSISSSPMLVYEYEAPSSPFKTYLSFGEHSRELISPELGLAFIEYMCESALDISSFIIIANANPISRRKVEEGDWCLRTNENGVDINRNWAAFWQPSDCEEDPETCPGPYPFSESQTKTLRNMLTDFKPNLYLSVHSGTAAMLLPYSHNEQMVEDQQFYDILEGIAEEYCSNCSVGTVSDVLGYPANGTGTDYSFEYAETPDSVVFEIYKQEETSYLNFFQRNPSNFLFSGGEEDECFPYFNPDTQDMYEETIRKWTDIIIELISQLQA